MLLPVRFHVTPLFSMQEDGIARALSKPRIHEANLLDRVDRVYELCCRLQAANGPEFGYKPRSTEAALPPAAAKQGDFSKPLPGSFAHPYT